MDKNNELHRTHLPDPQRDRDPAHQQNLDTVAQKPTHIGIGAPETAPAELSDADQAHPTRGAQPPEELDAAIRKPHHVAAGLTAVLQSAKFTFREMGTARGIKTWSNVNKKDGFDCQSCAWPSPDDHRHIFEFCENGVKAISSEATLKRITPPFFEEYSIADLLGKSDHWFELQGRLTHPMVRREGATHYEAISWRDAFALMATELNALPTPDAAAFYTSGRTSNEAAFLWQLFSRQFGTNNLPDCSNMCHESSGAALSETIGIGKGCVKLEDFEKTDLIIIVGQNPGTNHPRMLTTLENAKKKGAKILAINPMPEPGLLRVVNPNPQEYRNPLAFPVKMLLNHGTKLADLWLPVQINGDLAFFKGLMKEMLAVEDEKPGSVFDLEFIRDFTVEYDTLIADLRQTSWDLILKSTRLTREQIREAANMAIAAKKIIVCWAMGLTQHKNSVHTIREVMNFLLLGGNIGRPGAGPCPVRGHSNVQGDRTMGVWERMNDKFMHKLGEEFVFNPPKEHGTDTVETIKHMHDGKIRIFIGMGGNFLSATPDTEYSAHAMARCRLTAHVSTKLNRAHLITGEIGLILPCLGRTEIDLQAGGPQFVTVEDSMGTISSSRGSIEPTSPECLSEPAIVAGLAQATLGEKTTVDWTGLIADYDRIRNHIENVIPGFENFNERIKKDIFYLPNPPRDKREFPNGIGKAKFTANTITPFDLKSGEYIMMTIRTQDQFNTTIYGLDDRYRGVYNGRRVVFMNADDIKAAGLQAGQIVDLTSHFQGEKRVARHFLVTPFSLPPGCTATYFPEANVLIPINSTADRSNTPTSKSVVISVAPSPDADVAVANIRQEARASAQGRKVLAA